MNVFSVLESFLRATQDGLNKTINSDEAQTSGSGSDSFHIDMNSLSQDMTNIPWFLQARP